LFALGIDDTILSAEYLYAQESYLPENQASKPEAPRARPRNDDARPPQDALQVRRQHHSHPHPKTLAKALKSRLKDHWQTLTAYAEILPANQFHGNAPRRRYAGKKQKACRDGIPGRNDGSLAHYSEKLGFTKETFLKQSSVHEIFMPISLTQSNESETSED
jgi:hypothetical protein